MVHTMHEICYLMLNYFPKRFCMIKDDRGTSLTILKPPNGIVTADMELISASESLIVK